MTIIFTATLFVVIMLQVLFNTVLASQVYIDARKQELMDIYYEIISDYKGNAMGIYENVHNYEDELNLRVFIYDERGNIIYETLSNKINSSLISQYSLTEQGRLVKNFMKVPQANVIKSYRNDTQAIAVRGFVETNMGNHYIVIETPVAGIHDATQTLNEFAIKISLITMMLGAIIIYFFSSKLSKPITQISKVARNVSNLDFSTKAPVGNGHYEIEDLAHNINFMSEKLEQMIYDLKVANIELKRDNDVKKQVDNMRKEFIGNVSHELKTPLSLMQGYTEILKLDVEGIDKEFYYDVIIDESNHMNELVKRLLNVSSLENGLTKLSYEKFDLLELANWIVSKSEIISMDKALKVTSNLQNAMVFADKLYIEQSISNFISNAVTYAKDEIIIDIQEMENRYRLSVFNDGNQIDDKILDKIWYSFYREDKSRTRSKDKNFGLGLYIVKTIISAHDGDVGAYNTDNGVCFWFEIDKN